MNPQLFFIEDLLFVNACCIFFFLVRTRYSMCPWGLNCPAVEVEVILKFKNKPHSLLTLDAVMY